MTVEAHTHTFTVPSATADNIRNGTGGNVAVEPAELRTVLNEDLATRQLLDAGLTSIAGLTTAADKSIYTTGSDTYATYDLTAFGRSLADDANAAAGRATLGFPATASRYLKNDASGVPTVATASQTTNLDALAAVTPGAEGLAILADGVGEASEDIDVTRTALSTPTLALPAIHIKSKSRDYFSAIEAVSGESNREAIRNHTTNFDCAAYLNDASDYASRRGYQTLLINDGLWLLSAATQGTYNAICLIRNNLTYLGQGRGTHIKVADSYTNGGDYRVFAPSASGTMSNVAFKNLYMDGNGANNLVIDSGANLRRAYSISIPDGGSEITVDGCWFENNPGRNVINLSDSSADPIPFSIVRLTNNVIRNVGGSISGNENQNDHSSFYSQSEVAIVTNNIFEVTNTNFNPFVAPTRAVVALEIHGARTLVANNIARRYGTLGNVVGSVHDSWFNIWRNNVSFLTRSNAMTLWSYNGFYNRHTIIDGNIIEIDNSTVGGTICGGSGIYQNPDATVSSTELDGWRITNNTIYGTVDTPLAKTSNGISLVTMKNSIVAGNKIRNIQGCGINMDEATANLGFDNVDVLDNEIVNCGIHTGASRVHGIRIVNSLTTRQFRKIRIDRNRFVKKIEAVGTSPNNMRGIAITGPGYLRDIEVGPNNTFENIRLDRRVEITSTTENIGVRRVPRRVSVATASFPDMGEFEIGAEIIDHTDASASYPTHRVPSTSGCGYSTTWSTGATVKPGQWVRLPTTAKIIEYVTGGTTHAATEPNPATLEERYTDNTADYVYRYSTPAVFQHHGWGMGQTLAGDAAATFTPGSSQPVIIYNVPITADRAVTLSTTGAINGMIVEVVRTANATGAFNVNVGTGPLKALATASTSCRVIYNSTAAAWQLLSGF